MSYGALYAIHMFKPMDTYCEYFVAPLKWMLPERSAKPVSLLITTDDYIPNSVKEGIRKKRGESGIRFHVSGLEQKMPNLNK